MNPAQRLLFGILEANEVHAAVQSAQQAAKATAASGRRRGGGRRPSPENLPIHREVIDLPEEQKIGLVKIREEITEQIEYRPSLFFRLQTVRPVYAHPKKAHAPIIAALPPQVIPQAALRVHCASATICARGGESQRGRSGAVAQRHH